MTSTKAGPITLALGLIFFGVILLISNVTHTELFTMFFKFWPLLLIGLGIEYFIKSYKAKQNNGEDVRFHFPTIFIILLLAGIGIIAQQALLVLQNKDINSFISEAISGGKYSYSYDFVNKPVDIKSGTKININNIPGDLEVVPSIDGKLHVNARIVAWGPSEQEAKDRAKLAKVEINEDKVIDISCQRVQTFNNMRPSEISLRISIPENVYLDIDGQHGEIKADNLTANINIRSSVGEVSLSDIKGDVKVEEETGEISLEKVIGNCDVSMSTGQIRLADVSGSVNARNRQGEINIISNFPIESNYNISNTNGEITLRIPDTSNATITANTKQGSISGSLKMNGTEKLQRGPGQSVSTVLGSGKATVNLYNEIGSIKIYKN